MHAFVLCSIYRDFLKLCGSSELLRSPIESINVSLACHFRRKQLVIVVFWITMYSNDGDLHTFSYAMHCTASYALIPSPYSFHGTLVLVDHNASSIVCTTLHVRAGDAYSSFYAWAYFYYINTYPMTKLLSKCNEHCGQTLHNSPHSHSSNILSDWELW